MQHQDKITDTYNLVAAKYASRFINELDHKPLDRMLLREFAETNKAKGTIIDLGCGPGQTTHFLFALGCSDILGTDLSDAMIAEAQRISPQLNFEVADLLNLCYPPESFGSAIAFYAIVNFDYTAIETAFQQVYSVLKSGGQFLLSFHTGEEIVHLDALLDEKVDIDFYFLDVDKIILLLKKNGFKVMDTLIRYPYPEEYPSKRAYIKVEKLNLTL